MSRKLKIDTGEAKFGPYSPGICVRDHIWLSGQIDVDAGDEIELQAIGTWPRLMIYLRLQIVRKLIW